MARESKSKVARRLTDKIERKFEKKQPVIDRMDQDYQRYKMTPFVPSQEEALDEEDAYTTNLDRVSADKAARFIGSAERIIRTVKDSADKQRNLANENLEKFAIGVLSHVDERLDARGELSVQDQLAWYSPVRGQHVVMRSLLTKDSRGETVPEMLPMDPRNFVFEKGDDELEWCAYRMVRTRDDIQARYPKFRFEQPAQNVQDREQGSGAARETLYDYYETRRDKVTITDPQTQQEMTLTVKTYWNAVIVPHENRLAKPFHNTHAVHFPVIVRAAGLNPGIAPFVTLNDELGEEEVDDTLKEQGDSIFALTRQITPFLNRVTSYNMKLTAMAADPSIVHQSSDGTASYDQSVFQKGSEVPTASSNQEEVAVLEPPKTGVDAQLLLTRVLDDYHAGGPSPIGLGAFPPGGLSASAIRLFGNSESERVGPFLRPVVSCILGALNAQIAQFETGSYRPIQVVGKSLSGPFEDTIKAEDLRGHGLLSVELVPILPTDDNLKWITAQIATAPNANGEVMTSMQYAREDILKIQDSELEDSRIRLSQAKNAAPVLTLIEMMEAALRANEREKAQYLQGRIQQLLLQEKIEFMALLQAFGMGMDGPLQTAAQGMGGQNGGGGQQTAQGPGPRPEMASVQNFRGPFTPSPTAGQNSTAARPGARTEQR